METTNSIIHTLTIKEIMKKFDIDPSRMVRRFYIVNRLEGDNALNELVIEVSP